MGAGSAVFVADGTAVMEAGVEVRASVAAAGAGAGDVLVAADTAVREAGVEVSVGVTDAGSAVGAAVVAVAAATAAVGNPAAGTLAADFCGSHAG